MEPIQEVVEKREVTTPISTFTLIAYTDGWAGFVKNNAYPCHGHMKYMDWNEVQKHLDGNWSLK